MVVDKVDINGIAVCEAKNNPPIPADHNRPESLAVLGHRMQPKSRRVHVGRIGGNIKARKHALHLGDKVRPDSAAIVALEQPL
jgi:hypothetical protein